ncbi:hypothetical protein H0H81_002088 [Sphagnurus paluster]|uniref:G-protein coupled receptors family 1 profile domain-containing protein n=1 Tax=Sphagnurus paluster TaxID=117069 RepID=A0A9P7K6F0_9AGAR|nr:hypothetical protein H0H81_002088 [Sphagnurus paluster]
MADIIPDGIVCTAAQYARFKSGDPSIYCINRSESLGLLIVTQIGLLSLVSVCYVFFIIGRNVVRHMLHSPDRKVSIVQEPMDIFMLSLFCADFVQALGAVMDIKWIHQGVTEIGPYCTAQGVIQQLGETGVAITTLLIAIYTFIGVWWRIGMGKRAVNVARIVILTAWAFVFIMVIVPNILHANAVDLYQGPTPYHCWITNNYLQWRIWGEYFWFWITLAFSSFAYTLLFLWSRGNITLNEYSWWRFSIHRASKFDTHQSTRMQSLVMLAYPIVYMMIILPLCIVRWIGFVQESAAGGGKNRIGAAPTLTVIGIYGFSGLANVILLLTTRPNSVLFGHKIDYSPRTVRPNVGASAGAVVAGQFSSSYKGQRDSVGETDGGDPSSDLGRLPSRSSAGGWA